MHNFEKDFYGHPMKVIILGYIRPELDYTSRGINQIGIIDCYLISHLDDLIEDIEQDKRVGLNSLDRPAYKQYQSNEFFSNPKQYHK